MGKCFSTLGTKNRSAKLETWKTENWEFSIPCGEVTMQLFVRKRKAEALLDKEVTKRQKLEKKVTALKGQCDN